MLLRAYASYVKKKSSADGSAIQKISNFSRYLAFALKKKKTAKSELEAVVDTGIAEMFLTTLKEKCKASASTILNYVKAVRFCLDSTHKQWPELVPKSSKFKDSFRIATTFWELEGTNAERAIKGEKKRKACPRCGDASFPSIMLPVFKGPESPEKS